MPERNNDDSSSSEDEIAKDALREATDHEFLKNNLFSTPKSEGSDVSGKIDKQNHIEHVNDLTNLKSLRRNLDENDKFENFGVSASFQNYVAKKLDEIIEKSIKIKEKKKKDFLENNKETIDSNSGIKLLNSSVEFLTAKEDEELHGPSKRRKVNATIDDKKNLLKCKEVAVDPEWILSKEETKAWSSRRKAPEFKYKKQKNGTLVEET